MTTAKYPQKARWARFLMVPVEERLADAMLEARAGASGNFDGAEQKRRTVEMAEWIIARLAFHDLALTERVDDLSDEARQTAYRDWLHHPASTKETP